MTSLPAANQQQSLGQVTVTHQSCESESEGENNQKEKSTARKQI